MAPPALAPQRAADLVARDDRLVARDARAVAQPREPLGDRERARLEHPLQHRVAVGDPLAGLLGLDELTCDSAR